MRRQPSPARDRRSRFSSTAKKAAEAQRSQAAHRAGDAQQHHRRPPGTGGQQGQRQRATCASSTHASKERRGVGGRRWPWPHASRRGRAGCVCSTPNRKLGSQPSGGQRTSQPAGRSRNDENATAAATRASASQPSHRPSGGRCRDHGASRRQYGAHEAQVQQQRGCAGQQRRGAQWQRRRRAAVAPRRPAPPRLRHAPAITWRRSSGTRPSQNFIGSSTWDKPQPERRRPPGAGRGRCHDPAAGGRSTALQGLPR